MALDKPSQSAGALAATLATGLVSVFAALAPHTADARGAGGGAHNGGGAAHGASVGHPSMGGGRFVGGNRFFRSNPGFRGFRGPRVFIGGGPFFYGVPYYVAPPVYVVPPTYIPQSTPQQRQAQPASSGQMFCYPWKDQLTCSYPDGSIHKFSIPTTPPVPTNTTPLPVPPKAPPKAHAPAACYRTVVQVHAFNSTSELNKQFPKSIPDNCSALITRINAYNDQPATDIQRNNGVVTINYNGSKVDTNSDAFIAGSLRERYNIAALTPSSTWDNTFPSVDSKHKPVTHRIIVHSNTSANTIEVDPKRGDDGVTIFDKPVAPASAITQNASTTGTASAGATAQATTTPQHLNASSTTAPSKGHWYTSWWLWGTVAVAGVTALIARAINNSRYSTIPDPTPRNPEGGPEGGGAPRPEAGAGEPITARRENTAPEISAEPLGTASSLKAFNDAEKRGILTAFLENRGDRANQIRFKLNETRDAMLVSTKDADAEVRREGSKATLKTGAVTFSDETIKGMLESHYNLNGGAGKEGKHRIAVNCSDEVFARVVDLVSKAEGQPFEIVRKGARPVDNRISPGETAATETPARPVAANDHRFVRPLAA